jgi:hypothetical protein
VDVSAFLFLPFSGLVAAATVIAASLAGRRSPRLIWPCALSTALGALVFLRVPQASWLGLWIMILLSMAFSAAIGTVIGAAMAKLAITITRALKRRLNA